MKHNNRYKLKKDKKDMTLIIGMKYKEGIILIGDTMVSGGSETTHDNKIVAPVQGINVAVGSAGFTQLAKEFNQKITIRVQERLSEYRLANIRDLMGTGIDITEIESGKVGGIVLPWLYKGVNFLDDCASLTKQLAETSKVYLENPLESLVALYLQSQIPNPETDFMLYQIDCNGFKVDVPYTSIGSGTDHIGDYLKRNYYKDITLNEAILLGTFLIKYVEILGFDKGVGLETGKLPQIFLIKQDYFDNYLPNDDDKDLILREVKKRIDRIRSSMLLFNSKGKRVDKPVWGKR